MLDVGFYIGMNDDPHRSPYPASMSFGLSRSIDSRSYGFDVGPLQAWFMLAVRKVRRRFRMVHYRELPSRRFTRAYHQRACFGFIRTAMRSV